MNSPKLEILSDDETDAPKSPSSQLLPEEEAIDFCIRDDSLSDNMAKIPKRGITFKSSCETSPPRVRKKMKKEKNSEERLTELRKMAENMEIEFQKAKVLSLKIHSNLVEGAFELAKVRKRLIELNNEVLEAALQKVKEFI